MQATKLLRQQLNDQANLIIEKGVHPYDAYLHAYQTAEALKEFLLSLNRKEWKRVWKISYYFNKKAGLALELSKEKLDCNMDSSSVPDAHAPGYKH